MLRKLSLRAFTKLKEKLSMKKTKRKRRFRVAKKAASEENLRRRRLKNKTVKLFMKRIRKREGSVGRRLFLKNPQIFMTI